MTAEIETATGETIDAKLPEWSAEFWPPKRVKVAHGGRFGGRDNTFARMAILRCLEKPGTRVASITPIHLMAHESQTLRPLFRQCIEDLEVVGRVKDARESGFVFENDSEIRFMNFLDEVEVYRGELATCDIAWVTNAQNMTRAGLRMLLPSMRQPNSEIWFTFNPTYGDDPVYKHFDFIFNDATRNQSVTHVTDQLVIRQVNYIDNPWFPEEADAERFRMLKDEPDRYDHVWLGELLADERPKKDDTMIEKEKSDGRRGGHGGRFAVGRDGGLLLHGREKRNGRSTGAVLEDHPGRSCG